MKRDDNPYVSFKNDRDRLWALVSRDVRIAVVAGLCALAGYAPMRAVVQAWLG